MELQITTAVAQILRGHIKPVLLVSNKADTFDWRYNAAEFYKLGLGENRLLFRPSMALATGTGDFLDKLLTYFKPDFSDEIDDELPRFAVVGRPNAGKSSIVNAFIGEERTIVTDIAGTTRRCNLYQIQ